jgi:peptidoglycan hydrolase CwlO-like protein
MADGSLVFDTRIDSDKINEYFKEIDKEYGAVNKSTKELQGEVKRLESEYKRLRDAMDFAAESGLEIHENMREEIKKVGSELKKTRAELDTTIKSEKTLAIQSKASLVAVSQTVNTVGSSFAGVAKMILRSLRSVFVFSLISASLRDVRNVALKVFPQLKDLETSFTNLKVAIIRAAGPIINVLMPALHAAIQGITELVNVFNSAIRSIVSFFGGSLPNDIETTSKALYELGGATDKTGKQMSKSHKSIAQFDKIMQLQKTSASESASAGAHAAKVAKSAADTLPAVSKLEEILKGIGPLLAGYLVGGKKGLGIASLLTGAKDEFEAALDQLSKGITWENFADTLIANAKLIFGTHQLFGSKGAGAVAALLGETSSLLALADQWAGKVTWSNFAQKLAGDCVAAIGSYVGAGGGEKGEKAAAFATFLNGIMGEPVTILEQWKKGVDWKNFAQTMSNDAQVVAGAWKLWGNRAALAALGVLGLKNALIAMRDINKNGLNWENATQGLVGASGFVTAMVSLSKSLGNSGVVGGLAGVGIIGALGVMMKKLDDFNSDSGTWHDAFEAVAAGVTAFGLALGLFLGPTGWIIALVAAVAGMVVAVIKNWDEIKAWFSGVWESIKPIWNSLWTNVKDACIAGWTTTKNVCVEKWSVIAKWFGGLWNGIKSGWQSLWDNVKSVSSSAWEGIKSSAGKFVDWIKGLGKRIWEAIKHALGKAGTWVVEKLSGLVGSSQVHVGLVYDEPTQLAMLNTALASTGFRTPAIATGSVTPTSFGSLGSSGGSSSGGSEPISVATLTAAFTQALKNSGLGSAVVQVDGRTFGSLVYEYGNREGVRVGNNLLVTN